jgi:hypothetical protein
VSSNNRSIANKNRFQAKQFAEKARLKRSGETIFNNFNNEEAENAFDYIGVNSNIQRRAK